MNKDNFWAELDSSHSQNNNFWSELDTQTNQQNSQPTLGNRIASGVKSVVSGAIGAIPDSLAAVYNIPTMASNAAVDLQNHPSAIKAKERLTQLDPSTYKFDTKRPLIPSATEAIAKGIDTVTGGYTNTPQDSQKHINTGIEFATGLYAPGKLAQNVANKGISKVAGYLGSTNPWQVGATGTAGSVMSGMQDNGANTAETLGTGTAINLVGSNIPNIAKGTGNIGTKAIISLAGLGKNNLDIQAVKAAKELGIDLPRSSVTSSERVALLDTIIDKLPIVGGINKRQKDRVGEEALKLIDSVYDSIIPAHEIQGVNDKIDMLYEKAKQVRPEVNIIPTHTLERMEKIKSDILKTPSPDDAQLAVLRRVDELKQKLAPNSSNTPIVSLEGLVEQKKSLYNEIGDYQKPGYVRNKLKQIPHALNEDFLAYSKTSKEASTWYDLYKPADQLRSKKHNWEALNEIFKNKTQDTVGDVTYKKLADVLSNSDTRKELSKIVDAETMNKLDNLQKVSVAMYRGYKNNPNKSGTAATTWLINAVMKGTILPMMAVGTLFVRNKTLLDSALKFAETGEKAAAMTFNQRMKAITGYTPITLMRELNKEGQKNSPEWASFDKNKFLEESKKWDDRSSFILTPDEMKKMRENKRD